MLAVFACVVQVANDVPSCSASESRLPEFVYREHAFKHDGLELFFTDDGSIDHAWRPSVLPDCFYQQEGLLMSDADWCSLEDFMDFTPGAGADEESERACEPRAAEPTKIDLVECPWLVNFLGPVSTSFLPGADVGAEREARESVEAEEGTADDVMDELYAKRLSLAEGEGCGDANNFVWQLRGGRFTSAKTGMTFDCFASSAKKGMPSDWCLAWGLTRSASFSIRLYGEETAFQLVRCWVHVHEWMYGVCLEFDSDPAWNFTHEVRARYEEPEVIRELYLHGSAACRARIDRMRALLPARL